MSAAYDIFISYSRKDNEPLKPGQPGWVTALHRHILEDHRRFSTEPLRLYFDLHSIRDMDDWRHNIQAALRASKILLVCLSPNYFASECCRMEWEEYLKRQVHQLMGSESVATVYFVEVPGSDEQANAKRLTELTRGNFTDVRPWFPEGAEALQLEDVRQRMARLGETLWERIQRARRAMAVPGNLRWQNPHFVGRVEELRKLHEQLGIGAVGVVTAVQGLGGQGKTELAVAYAHGYADNYPAGLWSLGAEGHKELLPLIGSLAWERALGFTPTEAEKNDPVLLGRGVLDHLKARAFGVPPSGGSASEPPKGGTPSGTPHAALLLLDNVSEPSLLSPAQLATLPGGLGAGWLRILATTRLEVAAQRDRLAVIEVASLDPDSALTLICDHQPLRDAQKRPVTDPEQSVPKGVPTFASEAEESAAREIVRALGGFTLAVEQVALYLGLHPDVQPSAFLATLQSRGLPVADTLPQRDADVAAQMHTQSKQLALILEATLARLDDSARTALQFAALLPPDTVPWPWLRELTVAAFDSPLGVSFGVPPSGGSVFGVPPLGGAASGPPEGGTPNQTPNPLTQRDAFGADPWAAVRRRLSGLRLLTPGDHPEIARIHRLVAAHLAASPSVSSVASALEAHLSARAWAIYRSQAAPADWELDALLIAAPHWLTDHPVRDLANAAVFMSEKLLTYRTLPAAATFLASVHAVIARLAARDPANAEWQRDLSVSFNKLGDLATAQGNLPEAQRLFGESLRIAQRLAESDPANAAWQRDLSVSLGKLGDLATAQGNLPEAQRLFGELLRIRERLAESDSANAEWQRDLAVSHFKLYQFVTKKGDAAMQKAELRACFTVLDSMKQRGLHLDPPIAQLHGQLKGRFGHH